MPTSKGKKSASKKKKEIISDDAQDITSLLSAVPCREKQINDLVSLLGRPWHHTVPCLFVYGHSSSGKSVVIRSVLEFFELPYFVVNCVECYVASILFQEVLHGLYSHAKAEDKRSEFELPKKCDNINDFVRYLKKMLECLYAEETVYIVLTNAERLRERDATFLPALMRLQQSTSCNVCVVLESKLPWEKYVNLHTRIPCIMFFPGYTKEELRKIMVLFRPPGVAEDFYGDYVGVILSVFFTACNDLRELRYFAELNYPTYCEPIKKGEATEADRLKLWKNIEPHLRHAVETLYLRETSSLDGLRKRTDDQLNRVESNEVAACQKQSGLLDMVELPFYSKFLLIAAYLASYNPVKTDMRFFVKNAGKNKKTLKGMKKDEQKSAHLKGPKAFPLDRMLAIFYSIVGETGAPSACIFSQITSLVSLHLLTLVGQEDQIDSPKYKCITSFDFIQAISRTVNFDVVRYLYDFI